MAHFFKQPAPPTEDDSRPTPSGVRRARPVVLRVLANPSTGMSTVQLDAPLHDDILPRLEATLFDMRVQVVRRHVQVTLGRAVRQLEVVEFDGAPLGARRNRELELALARELDAVVDRDGPRAPGTHKIPA